MLNRLQDVFKSFQQHDVKYVVIGGIASILHGVPRATFDLDILIEATPENTRRLLDALLDAGLGTAALTNVDDLLANEITIFRDRVRLDVQTSTPSHSSQRRRMRNPPASQCPRGNPDHIWSRVQRERGLPQLRRGRPWSNMFLADLPSRGIRR